MYTKTVEHVYVRILHVERCLTPIKRNGVCNGWKLVG